MPLLPGQGRSQQVPEFLSSLGAIKAGLGSMVERSSPGGSDYLTRNRFLWVSMTGGWAADTGRIWSKARYIKVYKWPMGLNPSESGPAKVTALSNDPHVVPPGSAEKISSPYLRPWQ
jgi:hypothetical protein